MKLSKRLVPEEMWAVAEPLLPKFSPSPQTGFWQPVSYLS
ncbi:hypothetical protein JMUB6875_76820 [Nocardia sp. JMUB6875]